MKIGIVVLFLANCYFFQSCSGIVFGSSYSNRLKNFLCFTQSRRCQQSIVNLLCPQTCNFVSRGVSFNARTTTTKCEIGCKDEMASITCDFFKKQNKCGTIGELCRLTCGKCTKCQTPPPPCTNDCKDNNNDCSNWKKKGYCKKSSKYHIFMENECPLSCGICELCPTPAPPNTALPPPPPTPRACSPSDCNDTNKHCKHWAEIGQCNKTEKFPYLLEVCQKSCNVCTPCPKLLPPPPPTKPPCSEDCKDTNGECEFWKSQDYCNSTSEHYDFMNATCPVSCDFCEPCAQNQNLFILEKAKKL